MKNEEVEELSVQLGDLTIRISKRTDQPDLPPSSEVIRESPAPSGALAGSSGASHSATQAGRGSAQSETWELVTPTSPAPWTEDWEAALVAAVTPEAILQLDLSPVRHLLSRIRTTSNGWTPLARLGRALRAGIQARQKLDTGYSHPGSTSAVTLPTKVYLVLQPAPGGQTGWTEDFHTFARQVREPNTNLHPHSVSHGFPSRAEADAYLLWSPAGMAASAPAGGMNEENIRALWNAQTPTGPLPGLFLVLPAREDGTGQRVACHLVKIRSGGFMVIFPALSAVADFLEGQEAAAGIEPYALYEASTEMETSRGRRLGAESCLLADLVWDLAPLFIRAHSLRTASVEVHKFMVGDTVGRPRRAEAIACADQWIHEVMDDDTAGDYVTGESDALEAHEPELLPASGTEGVDLEAMQRRIHELEQMLQSPGSPGGAVLRPVSKASAKSSPARGVLFGGTQTIPSEAPVNDVISRLRAAAGAAPMRLAAHERALREGMPETNLNALQSEVGLEAVEDGEIESGLKDLVWQWDWLPPAMHGCASNVQQPHDAVANCLKHWKHNYSQMFECLHVCCRNRRGPDHVLTARVRAAVNLRERPAPGLDAHHRHGNTRQPKRIVQDRAILDDPLDEDQTDEAVATFREMSERAVEFGTSRRGSISWTSKTISDFMRKRKDLQEIKKARRTWTWILSRSLRLPGGISTKQGSLTGHVQKSANQVKLSEIQAYVVLRGRRQEESFGRIWSRKWRNIEHGQSHFCN
eukprot:g19674.t1